MLEKGPMEGNDGSMVMGRKKRKTIGYNSSDESDSP